MLKRVFLRIVLFILSIEVLFLLSGCSTFYTSKVDNYSKLLRRIDLLESRVEFNSQLININSQRINEIEIKLQSIKNRLAKEREKDNQSSNMMSYVPPASLVNKVARDSINVKKPKSVKIAYSISTKNSKNNANAYKDYKKLYSTALSEYKKGNYRKAAYLFKKFGKYFSNTDLYDNSIYWRAYCYLHLGEKSKAIKLLNELVNKFPFSPLVRGGKTDAALFTLIRIYKEDNNKKEQKYYEKLLLERFPDSIFSKRIKNELGSKK